MKTESKYMTIRGALAKVSVTMTPVFDGVAYSINIEAFDLDGRPVYLTAAESAEACKGV